MLKETNSSSNHANLGFFKPGIYISILPLYIIFYKEPHELKARIKECVTQRLCWLSVKTASDYSVLTINPPFVAPVPPDPQPPPCSERGKQGCWGVTQFFKRPASWGSIGMPTPQGPTEQKRDRKVMKFLSASILC